MSADCDLCGSSDSAPLYGLEICEACRQAELEGQHTEAWGAVVTVEHSRDYDPTQLYQDAFVHHVKISIQVEEAVPVAAHFETERARHRLVKLFREELQAGDARFDDAIYIVESHRAATEKLLHVAGAREAILVLVGDAGKLDLTPGQLKFCRDHRGKTEVAEYTCAARALALHLHRLQP